MKKIAITQRLILNSSYYELREALDVKWGLVFDKLNFLPIILPVEYNFENFFKSINIDGIFLTGGNDLEKIHGENISGKRDAFEMSLIDYGIQKGIPIFGVCRGMQIIADYFKADFKEVKNQVNIKHKLSVNKNSKYLNELEKIDKVNSFHNYGINNLPEELLISATNPDGMIKAIEHKTHLIFGQMWHPEREENLNTDELNLIKKFFNG